jgi:hypothetical protein
MRVSHAEGFECGALSRSSDPTSDRFDAGLTADQRPVEIKRNKLDRHAELSYQVELKPDIVRIAEGDELGLWVRVDVDPHSRHAMPSESFDATLWRQTGSAV